MKQMIIFVTLVLLNINYLKAEDLRVLVNNEEYFCSKENDELIQLINKNSTETNDKKCDLIKKTDYIYFKGKTYAGYYKYHEEPTIWIKAYLKCRSECAHLAIPNTNEEMEFLYSLYDAYPKPNTKHPSYVLIGISDIQEEGQFYTVLDEPIKNLSQLNWCPNEPSSTKTGKEDCLTIENRNCLNDFPCFVPATFICERNG